MGKDEPKGDAALEVARTFALRLPHVVEGLACKGTSIESATFKVRGKSFLFLRRGQAMVKLDASRADAGKRAAKEPRRFKIGAGGWATVTYGPEGPPAVLERWIAESHALFAAPPARRKTPE